jgi:hypothetical protein
MMKARATVLATLAVLGVLPACTGERTPRPSPAADAAPAAVASPGALFVYVKIPGGMLPIERGERFEDPLQEALQAAGVGEVSGGGTEMSAPDAQGRQRAVSCGIDVDLSDSAKGLPLLRQTLVRLGVPKGTVLQYEANGRDVEEPVP